MPSLRCTRAAQSARKVTGSRSTRRLMVPRAWPGVRPAPARPVSALLVATLPWFTYSLICAWCMAARSCQIVVAIEVPKDVGVVVLALLAGRIVETAGLQRVSPTSPVFVEESAAMLRRCFAFLRNEVGSRGHRDVLKVLQDATACRRVLKFFNR